MVIHKLRYFFSWSIVRRYYGSSRITRFMDFGEQVKTCWTCVGGVKVLLCSLINSISFSHLKKQSIYLSSKYWGRIAVKRVVMVCVTQLSFCFLHIIITTVAEPLSAGLMTNSFSAILRSDRDKLSLSFLFDQFFELSSIAWMYVSSAGCLFLSGIHLLFLEQKGLWSICLSLELSSKNIHVGGGVDRRC